MSDVETVLFYAILAMGLLALMALATLFED